MRFRAKIDHVLTFSRIVQTVEKLTKQCVMRWSPDSLQIICPGGENEGGVQVWSKIKTKSLFSDYKIESGSNNEINMEVATEPLYQALRSAQSSPDVIIKLAKKDDHAVLNFDVQAVSQQGKTIQVTHDVRINIIKLSEVEKLQEPQCPEPDVHIILPPLAKLRTVTDHMRPLSTLLGVSANRGGGFSLKIQTEEVAVETVWSGCDVPKITYDDEEGVQADPEEWYHAIVSVKSFLQFLSSYVVSTTTIACICQDHCLIMYVYIGEVEDHGGVLTFYIPARNP